MGRKHIIGFAVFGVVVLGYFLFFSTPNTITLTEHGFTPREMTVSTGETVTFVNKRDKYFWPASDFHPTHAAYPEFDAQRAIAPGASWSFTFDEPGLYKYHDHLAPFFFGIVRVSDENGRVVDDCRERGGNLACWQDEIFIALAEDGIDGAYDAVGELYETEPDFAQSCHFIAHNIGLASYGFYREDPTSILSPKASACASGFYHGFMEAYLGATGDVVQAGATCESIGESLKNEAPDARFQCYHGIGHGAVELLIAGTGVFGTLSEMVDEALVQCERASDGDEERFRCASGIFNGVANFYINEEYGLDVTTSNPLDLCAVQKERIYADACYGNMNSVAYWMTGENFVESVELTLRGAETRYATLAIEYLAGLHAFYKLPTYDRDTVVLECRALGAYSIPCIVGFTHGLLEHGTPQREYEDALSFCAHTLLSSVEKDACYTEALSQLHGWYASHTVTEICSSLPVSLQAYCPKEE